jgi:hypothetical protein
MGQKIGAVEGQPGQPGDRVAAAAHMRRAEDGVVEIEARRREFESVVGQGFAGRKRDHPFGIRPTRQIGRGAPGRERIERVATGQGQKAYGIETAFARTACRRFAGERYDSDRSFSFHAVYHLRSADVCSMLGSTAAKLSARL